MIFSQWAQKPFFQLLVFVFFTLVALAIVRPAKADNAWVIAGIAYGCFIVVNVVCVCFADRQWHYFLLSLGASVVYFLLSGVLVSSLVKVMNLTGSGESGMIFLIIMYHPPALGLMMFLKWAFGKLF